MNAAAERIETLDVLRGIAILGILVMNIQTFALIEAAYFNPMAARSSEGINGFVWLIARLFADQKFMTIFAILFGAGVALMSEKAQRKGRKPFKLHFRRMGFLLLIGLLHAYIFWYGDILVTYALCGFLAYFFRNWRPVWLSAAGLALLLVPFLIFLAGAIYLPKFAPEAMDALASEWNPGDDAVQAQVTIYRGTWLEQMRHRAAASLEMQTVGNAVWGLWRAGGLMLLGMALLKSGFFAAHWKPVAYRIIILVGLMLGLAIESFGIYHSILLDWSVEVFFLAFLYNYCASLLIAAAYLSAVILLVHAGSFPALRARLADVGRMAFTNYLAQTLICTTLFYGHGFGLFGQLERWELFLIVILIWALQIVWSTAWLKHHDHGPVESLWRRFTYGNHPQPPPLPVPGA